MCPLIDPALSAGEMKLRPAELHRVCADEAQGDDRVLDEPLALLLGFAPTVRPGRVTSGAKLPEHLCSPGRLLSVDLAEDLLRPARRRKSAQEAFAEDLPFRSTVEANSPSASVFDVMSILREHTQHFALIAQDRISSKPRSTAPKPIAECSRRRMA